MMFDPPAHEKRSDDIELRLPGGASVRASGTLVVLLVVIIVGFALLVLDLRVHEATTSLRQAETNRYVQELTCVLTLTQEERIQVRMGESLSRWCVFLKRAP